jgi:hypothetical protein
MSGNFNRSASLAAKNDERLDREGEVNAMPKLRDTKANCSVETKYAYGLGRIGFYIGGAKPSKEGALHWSNIGAAASGIAGRYSVAAVRSTALSRHGSSYGLNRHQGTVHHPSARKLHISGEGVGNGSVRVGVGC